MDKFFDTLRKSPIKRAPGGWLGGVASGIAAQFNWPVAYVRIGILLSFLLPFISIPMYFVAWLLLPKTDGTVALQKIIGS